MPLETLDAIFVPMRQIVAKITMNIMKMNIGNIMNIISKKSKNPNGNCKQLSPQMIGID